MLPEPDNPMAESPAPIGGAAEPPAQSSPQGPEPAGTTLPLAAEEVATHTHAEPEQQAAAEPSAAEGKPASKEGEASIQTPPELEQLMGQYAAPQQAQAEGELTEGRVVAVTELGVVVDRKSTRLNSSHIQKSRMPSSA